MDYVGVVIRFVFSSAMNIQRVGIPADNLHAADNLQAHCRQTRPLLCNKVAHCSSLVAHMRQTYVCLQTGPQSAHLWWPVVAKMQAASVPTD